MSELREIWRIIRRKDFKDSDEVHAVEFNGGLMVSKQLYKRLKPKIEELPATESISELYGVQLISTPHLPYIYREAKRLAKPGKQL